MFFARAALFLPQNRSKRYARRNASVILIITMGILGGSSGNNNAHDLLSRTEHLLKKYQNHLPQNDDGTASDERMKRQQQQRKTNKNVNVGKFSSSGGNNGNEDDDESNTTHHHDSSFEQFLGKLEERLDDIADVSERAKVETNRAAIAAMHAEVRRGKNSLRGEIPKLRKLANKSSSSNNNAKKKKRATSDGGDIEDESMYERDGRETLIDQFEQRIEDVPDGVSRMIPRTPSKKVPHHHRSLSRDIEMGTYTNPFEQPETLREQHLNNNNNNNNNRFEGMEHTEESRQFRQEFEDRKKTQDTDLDEISRGLQTLKRLGADMDEEMARQQPAIENIDFKMDGAQAEMKTANMRLKETVEKARSSRHFCVDATLICVLLGIGMYLYRMLK